MVGCKYPDNVMRILRERADLSPDDYSRDSTFNNLTPKEVFTEVLEWEGIVGYEYLIFSLILDLFGVDLDDFNN